MTKHILYTSHVANFQKFNRPFMRMMSDKGWTVHYASAGEEEIKDADEAFTVDFARSPIRIDKHIKAYRQLKKILENNHYDIIHTHTPVGSVITRLAARQARKNGTRVIYTAHGFHFYKGAPLTNWLLWYPIEKIMAHYTDDIITINTEDYERAKRKLKTRIHYTPGVGVDPKKFQIKMTKKERNTYRATLGLKPDDFVMIYVAEINKNKNQKGLLLGKAEEIKSDPKKHILLVGADSLNGKIQKLAQKLNVENNMHFLGYRKDIPQLLKISDLYVSTSKREGLPVNILEARCSGLSIEASMTRGYEAVSCKEIKDYSTESIIELVNRIYA